MLDSRNTLRFAVLAIALLGAALAPDGAPAQEIIYLTNTGGPGDPYTDFYQMSIDEVAMVANLELIKADLPILQADALACSADDSLCYLFAKYQPGIFPDGGTMASYDVLNDTFTEIGILHDIDYPDEPIPEVVMAAHGPGPCGKLYVGSMETECLYVVDPETGAARNLGQITIEGTEVALDLSGADIVLSAAGTMYVWTNAGDEVPECPAGLYEIRQTPLDGMVALYLGTGSDGGNDPLVNQFSGLALRNNGLGNLIGCNRYNEAHEQALDGSDVAVYDMLINGEPTEHRTGDMHHSYDCFIEATLDRLEVLPGDDLTVSIRIVHNRPSDVETPIELWVETAEGEVLFSRTSRPRVFHWGDDLRKSVRIPVPEHLAAGNYAIGVGVNGMRQGRAVAKAWFTVQ